MESQIKTIILNALKELGVSEVDFVVEHPADLSHGDYASNIAMAAAKQLDKNPRELAEAIVEKLDFGTTNVERAEVAGPGFINFYLKRDFFTQELDRATKAGEEWGHNKEWDGKTVVVEYTDPNPFKELHVGHLFTNAVGESIARLFMASGAKTKRVNYQGDVGMHVAHALYGMKEMGLKATDDFFAEDLGKAYVIGATAYKENESAIPIIKAINKMVYDQSDPEINEMYTAGRQISLDYFESIYAIVDTQFDEYFFESETAPLGKAVVEAHPDVFVESGGARIFKGEEHGLHTRVFLNAEGLPTYEAKELALPQLKEDRLGTYDLSIVSTANEINEYFKVLLKAMSFTSPELAQKTEHIGHGTVRLSDGKMSSRTGKIIRAIDFIDEIGAVAKEKMEEGGMENPAEELARDIAVAAIKYTTLQGNVLQDTVFDKEKALSFAGNSGPYLQYTHARIHSVLQKAVAAGVRASFADAPSEAYEIEKILYRFEEVIALAAHERAPHHVTGFLTELAASFNSFYAQEKIADPSDQYAPYKVALSDAVRQTLKNGLWILGIKAPERM